MAGLSNYSFDVGKGYSGGWFCNYLRDWGWFDRTVNRPMGYTSLAVRNATWMNVSSAIVKNMKLVAHSLTAARFFLWKCVCFRYVVVVLRCFSAKAMEEAGFSPHGSIGACDGPWRLWNGAELVGVELNSEMVDNDGRIMVPILTTGVEQFRIMASGFVSWQSMLFVAAHDC